MTAIKIPSMCGYAMLLVLAIQPCALGAWNFNWATKTDWYGKKAGVFDVTPFPIDENTVSYTVTNDEGTKTFYAGRKYYVAPNGSDAGPCTSPQRPARTLAYAISRTQGGNETILVRGGVYREANIHVKPGLDESRRWSIVGYKQERPIFEGDTSANDIFRSSGATNAWATLQRLEIRNSRGRGIRIGDTEKKTDGHFALIDIRVSNCSNDISIPNDGNVYYLNADSGWVYHVTTEHTYGHGLKMGDGSNDPLVEWCVIRECGYWNSMPVKNYFCRHSAGLDFPNDAGTTMTGVVARYNVISDALFQGIQLRGTPRFDVHHNEVFHCARCWEFMKNPQADCDSHSEGAYQVEIFLGPTSGRFHSNSIRDPGAAGGDIKVTSCSGGNPRIQIYNNLFFGTCREAVTVADNNTGAAIEICSNSFYCNASEEILNLQTRDNVSYVNNILFQSGKGACATGGTHRKCFNRYFFPQGGAGVILAPGETQGDPAWAKKTGGDLDTNDFRPTRHLPGARLDTLFTDDFFGRTRRGWDVGAVER